MTKQPEHAASPVTGACRCDGSQAAHPAQRSDRPESHEDCCGGEEAQKRAAGTERLADHARKDRGHHGCCGGQRDEAHAASEAARMRSGR